MQILLCKLRCLYTLKKITLTHIAFKAYHCYLFNSNCYSSNLYRNKYGALWLFKQQLSWSFSVIHSYTHITTHTHTHIHAHAVFTFLLPKFQLWWRPQWVSVKSIWYLLYLNYTNRCFFIIGHWISALLLGKWPDPQGSSRAGFGVELDFYSSSQSPNTNMVVK